MSHHFGRGSTGGFQREPPPPPTINAPHAIQQHSSGRDRRYARSRSRSPPPRGHPEDSRSSRYGENSLSHYMTERDRGPQSRRKSPSPYSRSGHARQENTSHSSYETSRTSVTTGRYPTEPSGQIVRQIINPENIKIPRRENEGLRPIFDREELRDSIKRRMESDNNEQNPINSEQRVVAIIREPVTLAPQFIQPEIIPIIQPSQFLSDSMVQQPAPQGKFETSGGVSYSYSKDRSRSRSRSRGRRQLSPDRRRERHGSPRHHMEDLRNQHRLSFGRNGNRSRSPVRVERVRSVSSTSSSLYADITPNHYYEERLEGSRNYPWNDLRECINSRQQFVPGYTENPVMRGGIRGRGGPIRGIGFTIRKSGIPRRGPWKHDLYGREDEATEETIRRPRDRKERH